MAFERARLKKDFGDPIGEARACREGSAVFDFSFLECVRLNGAGACTVVEAYVRRPLDKLVRGAIAYAVRTNSSAAAVADLTVWRTGADAYEVMSGRREDVAALMACTSTQVETMNVGADRAVFAAQGPDTFNVLRQFGNADTLANLSYFQFVRTELAGVACTVGRLGYTGEAGFEIIVPRTDARRLWDELSRHARPAGFIAADMLRIEAGFVLYDNEFRLPVSPGEAGLRAIPRGAERPQNSAQARVLSRRDRSHVIAMGREKWARASHSARGDRSHLGMPQHCSEWGARTWLCDGIDCRRCALAGSVGRIS